MYVILCKSQLKKKKHIWQFCSVFYKILPQVTGNAFVYQIPSLNKPAVGP